MCGLDLFVFYQSELDRGSNAAVSFGSHRQVRLPGSGGGVGRGNKFVLLDMTEEPEAKKLTVYNTNEI